MASADRSGTRFSLGSILEMLGSGGGVEDELRLSSVFFAELFDSAPEAIVLIAPDGSILGVNAEFERLFGYTFDDLVGKNIDDLIVPPEHQESGRNLTREVGSGGDRVQMESVRVHRDGTRVPVSILAQPIGFDGRRAGTYVIYRDISRKKEEEAALRRAKDEAEAASIAKSLFLANTSHEIRTPLNAIIGMSDLLSETDLAEDQRKYVDIFRSAAKTLLDLINDVLDLSKIESGGLELEHVPFRLDELLADTVDVLAIGAHRKDLEMVAQFAPDLPAAVVGDPTRLRQVLLNLLGNAVKFTSTGEVGLAVSADAPGAGGESGEMTLSFRIWDTGPGIATGSVERVFERFTQEDASTTRRHGGTGLGLTICRSLVELMGGDIELESVVGKGTTFRFSLSFPVAGAVPAPRPAEDTLDLTGTRILIVDDNETNCFILGEMIKTWHGDMAMASSGPGALKLLRDATEEGRAFHLVLLDGHMPGMDGFEVAEEIGRHPEFARSTILMITSLDRPGDIKRSRELKVAYYMVKPVQRNALARRLAAVLSGAAAPSPGPPRAAAGADTSWKGIPEGAATRVLVAEDVEDNRLLLELYLQGTGIDLVMTEDGLEAVEAFRKAVADGRPFGLVLMDVQMPGMDGYDATRAIRRMEEEDGLAHTPIVALTAHAQREEAGRSAAAGCDEHLTKPIRKAELLAALGRHL